MTTHGRRMWTLAILFVGPFGIARAQPYGEPDRGQPGDAMIQAYLALETAKIATRYRDDVKSLADWQARRPQYMEEYFYMLGLSPRPEKTPLHAIVTGTFDGNGYVVDMLHYQSRPGLYVTGNLYRPASVRPGEKLPAVLYVCGHSGRGRNGNKVAFQSHGIWFARHGYVCLIIDTLQLGEIAASHHGTYNLRRWWWHSRGYTPAGVEALNGIRGIDYLVSRPDVDAGRIAVTGISGGGAATYWITCADDRVRAAVPVSGMADLESYVTNRVINGHCDCMFLYNTFQWPWTRIAGLVAPRPQMFVNSDRDAIFPMDANERIAARLELLYGHYGASDQVDTVVSIGGHAYRRDIREAAYRFINIHLKGDGRPVTDSEVDVVSEGNPDGIYPIPPEKLRVFPTDADLPRDQLNTRIDELFVPAAKVAEPKVGEFDSWKATLLAELKRVTFACFPATIPPATPRDAGDRLAERLESEHGIEFRLRYKAPDQLPAAASGILLVVLNEEEGGTSPEWVEQVAARGQMVVFCEPRGIGATKWTRRNGPNYVERAHVLLGRTVDTGRVWDVAAAAKYLATWKLPVTLAGKGPAGVIASYGAVWAPEAASVMLVSPSLTHGDAEAPQLLNVLRVCDVPQALGLVAPRPLTICGTAPKSLQFTAKVYAAAGVAERLAIHEP